MPVFNDNAGRVWPVTVTVDTIKRVRALTSPPVDLLTVLDGTLIPKLIGDPVLLCDVLYAVCKPHADATKVTDEDFGRAMAGDAIEQGTKALLDALVLFSPNPQDRQNLGKVLTTTWAAMDRARDLAAVRIEAAGPMIDSAIARALEMPGPSSTGAPESSALTQDP